MTRGLPSIVAIALVTAMTLARPVSAAPAADDGGEPPPTGRGLIIAGGVVGGVGLATMIPGVVLLILGRSSREGLGSAIGGILVGTGAIALATGTGLLVPGLVRRHRHREYEADRMDESMRARAIGRRVSLTPGGFVLRF